MPKEIDPEKFWRERLPSEISEIVFSEKTPEQIAEICFSLGIPDEKRIEKIAYQIGLVLLGKLPPESFAETLEKNLKLDKDIAEKISEEVNQLIFSQVKDELAKLYGVGGKPTPPPEEKPKRPPGKDVYRESIE